MDNRISKERWIELSKKLRDWVSAHFDPKELETIDEFIQLAGQSAAFDQVHQDDTEELVKQFEQLSRESKGNSRGWKFNREEIQRKIR